MGSVICTMLEGAWRILPFTGLLCLICYIDRVNVGFCRVDDARRSRPQAAFGLAVFASATYRKVVMLTA